MCLHTYENVSWHHLPSWPSLILTSMQLLEYVKLETLFQELFKDVQSLFCHFLVHVSQILDCKPSMTLLMPFMVSGMMRIGLDKSL